MIIRKNFLFQTEMFRYHHKEKYRTSLLNMAQVDPDHKTDSGFIIEIGYLLFALLVKIDEFQVTNRKDHRYGKQLMKLMPDEVRNDVPFNQNIFVQIPEFVADIYKRIKRICKRNTIDFKRAEIDAYDDIKFHKLLKFYADTTSQIDIHMDGRLVNYSFIILPHCRLSSDEQKKEFLQKLDRTTPQIKCESLMLESIYLIKEMRIDYLLKNNSTEFGKVLLKYIALRKALFFLFIFLINAVMLASYNLDHGSRSKDPKLFGISVDTTKIILLVLGILCAISWLLVYVPVVITIPLMQKYRYDVEHTIRGQQQIQAQRNILSRTTEKFWSTSKAVVTITYRTLTDPNLIYAVLLGVSIGLGLGLHPFFYAFLVTYAIVSSPQMNNLLRAIWEPKGAIIATIILMLLIVYLLVVWAYRSFPVDYPNSDCDSLWNCFIISFDQTLKNSGIGNYLNSGYTVKDDGVSIDYERLVFDNIEFLLITLLLIAIISGIIIDKFAELRSRREENIADAKSSCFICGRETKDIDKDLACPSFEYHVQLQHNLWDYVYFIAYLKYQEEHNPAGFSALEKYVIDKINKNDASWFPSYLQE